MVYKIAKIFIIAFALILSGANFNRLAAAGVADRIVATVGDEIILASELREGAEFMKTVNPTAISDSVLTAQVLDELIRNRLLLDQAKKETVDVSKAEVDQEVEKNIAQLKARFENEEQYQEALKNEGITERILRERYRDDIRKRLISQALLAKKGLTSINITPTAIQNFYKLHKDSIARQPGQIAIAHLLILIKPSTSEEEAGQKKITEIYDIIARGGDFEEVAKSFSEDKVTKDKGGYIGKISFENLQPEVQAVVSNLKPPEISQPFRSMNGYEIIKMIGKQGNNVELSHIMIKVSMTRADTLQTKKTAQKIRDILIKGANFDSIVKIYSDDPMTRDSGGYLGQFLLVGLQEPFRSAIESLPAGAVSAPVLSEHGYHLIKILARQDEKLLSLEEIQDQIRNYLFDEELQKRLAEYIGKIAKVTYIARYTD
jgi:peptidyl-prolyl cis-trans isomerase SurA